MTTAVVETVEQRFERYGLHPQLPKKFDHSTTGMYEECQRMFYWQHVLGRIPNMLNWNLYWGGVAHKLVDVWIKSEHTPETVDLVMQMIVDAIPELVEDRYGRDRQRMVDLFVAWADYNEKNPLKVLHSEQPTLVACLDSPCPYSTNGCGLVYGGRMDRIVDWNGYVGPLDVKTSVMDEQDPVAEYKPSHQMEGYVWIAAHLIGRHVWGVILEKIICNKSKLFIKRHPISYTKDAIVEWVEDEIDRQQEIRQKFMLHAHNPQAWRMNKARCYKPYSCAYRDICTAPRETDFRLKHIRNTTTEARWDFENPGSRDEAVGSVDV